MARQESDREDLLREATAMVQRAEIQISGLADSSFVGFRRDGCFSFYRQVDEVYHFNTAGELRRAYLGEQLVKAEDRHLVGLTRQRESGSVSLLRHEFDSAETVALQHQLRFVLDELSSQLDAGTLHVLGRVEKDDRVIDQLKHWLSESAGQITIAASPHAT